MWRTEFGVRTAGCSRWQILIPVLWVICAPSLLGAQNIVSVESETSFGESVGYAQTILIITKKEVRLAKHSWTKSDPDLSIARPTKEAEWLKLSQYAPLSRLADLPEVIGDPDDADQGEESLIIVTEARRLHASFDYGANPEGLADYLNVIRAIRAEMDKKIAEKYKRLK